MLIHDHPNSTVWVAGDLNLPNVDWKNWTMNANNYPLALCNLFIDLFVTLPLSISSNVKLYADNTLIYRIINTSKDATLLQKDLDALTQWAQKWMMNFKCVHLTITRKASPLLTTYRYVIDNSVIQQSKSAKYLG